MTDKKEKYVDLYQSGVIASEPWQNPEKRIFPHILIISEKGYALENNYPFLITQAPSFIHFLESFKLREKNQTTPIIARLFIRSLTIYKIARYYL